MATGIPSEVERRRSRVRCRWTQTRLPTQAKYAFWSNGDTEMLTERLSSHDAARNSSRAELAYACQPRFPVRD